MRRRSLLTLLILASLVAVAVLLPRTPAGRGWLLERARGAAASAGWTLDWDASAGNPWRAVELRGATLRGPGVDATAGRLEVAWFAPGLLTGDLPLWITLRDADVTIDAQALPASGGAGGGGPPVRPVLRELDLSGVRVQVGDAPYRLPDLRAEDLAVRGRGDAVEATGRLTTDEGALTFDARVGLAPFTLDADVRDGDVRIARAWWRGVTAGTAEGTVAFRPETGLTARLRVREGALRTVGLDVASVAGEVAFASGLVTADLSGAALDGPVAATGRVDVPNRRWSASLRATPDLAAAASWGAGTSLPERLRPSGSASVSASAEGWTSVSVAGSVQADGTLDGRPLTLRSDDVRYVRGEGLSLRAGGRALGGDVTVSGAPGGGATSWSVVGEGLRYGPARNVAGRVDLQLGERRTGTFVLDGEVRVGDGGLDEGASGPESSAAADAGEPAADHAPPAAVGPLRVSVDGEIDGGALQAFVDGRLASGGTLEGAARLEAGALQGAVRLRDVGPLAGEPVFVELEVDGPLASLPLRLALRGDAPWAPTLPAVAVDADLRGAASARLDGTRLRDVDGTFGPLRIEGDVALAADGAEDVPPLRWSLAPTAVSADLGEGTIEVRDGTFAPWGAGGSRLAGELTTRDLVLPAFETEALTAQLTATLPVLVGSGPTSPLAVEVRGATLEGRFADGRLDLALREQPVVVADTAGRLELDGTLRVAEPLASLRGRAELAADEARAVLEADDDGVRADVLLPQGTRLAGWPLARPLEATALLERGPDGALGGAANGDSDAGVAAGAGRELAGTLDLASGAVALAGMVSTGATVLDGRLTGAGNDAAVRVARGPWRVEVDGAADLGALADLVDLPVAGAATFEGVALTTTEATGSARIELSAPLAATATWRDGRVTGEVPAPGGPARLEGVLAPGAALDATLDHPWGRVAWSDGTLAGGGTLPAWAWRGVELPAVPWSVASIPADGNASPVALRAEVADGTAVWRDGNLDAVVDLPLRIGGRAARVTGTARLAAGASEPVLDLAVALAGPGDERVTAAGPWSALDLAGTLDAATALAAAELPIEANGRIEVDGRLDAASARGRVDGLWRAGDAELRIDAGRDADGLRLSVLGDGVDAELRPGDVAVRADEARLGTFLPALAGLALDGALAGPGGEGWRGELLVTADDLGGARLSGGGETLRIDADARAAGAELRAAGTVLPAVDVRLDGRHATSGAVLEARLEGGSPLAGAPWPALAGTVRLPALARDGYGLAASEMRLGGTLLAPRATGPAGGTIAVEDGRVDGTWLLEALVAEVPHLLELRVAGPLADPAAQAVLSGPLADARAELGGPDAWLTARASLAPGAWPAAAAPLAPEAAEVRARADRDGRWHAEGEARIAPGGRPLAVDVTADGQDGAGAAAWTLRAPDGAVLLAGDVDGSTTGATLSADLARLDVDALGAWAGVDASGEGRGVVAIALNGEGLLHPRADAGFAGTVAGRPVDASVQLGTGERDRVRLRSAADEWIATRRPDGGAWDLSAAGASYALTGQLAGDLASAALDGTVADTPFDLRVARESGGSLLAGAHWSGAQATLGVRSGANGWTASLDASAPARADLPVTGSLAGRLALTGGEVRLTRADLALLAPRPLEAELSGALWPRADLRGTLTGLLARPAPSQDGGGAEAAADPATTNADASEAIAVTVRGDPGAWAIQAATPGLSLRTVLSGDRPTSVELAGAGRVLYGVRVAPDPGGLRWDQEDGWTGGVGFGWGEAASPAAERPLQVDARATGVGEALRLVADGRLRSGPGDVRLHVDARASGAPWEAALDGTGSLRAELERTQASPAGGGATSADTDADGPADAAATPPALILNAPLRIGGTPVAPTAAGEATLRGAADAEGRIAADPGGVRIGLSGERLTLDAAADGAGWRVDLTTDDLPLGAWLPVLADPRLDAEAEAAATWREAPRGRLTRWTLRAEGGRAEGSAELGEAVAVTARVDADLAALLGGSASGRLAGPLSLRAEPGTPLARAELSGALSAEEVRLGDARVDGDVAVGGHLPSPDVRADLRLGGPVEGTLALGWRPDAGRLDLDADLSVPRPGGAVRIDLRAAGDAASLRADGAVTTPSGALRASADGGELRLLGESGLDGAELTLRPFADGGRAAAVRLPLALLAGAATGIAELELGPAPDGWLRGTVTGATVANVALPTADLRGRGARVTLQGDDEHGTIDAELALPAGAWRLDASGLLVPGNGVLELAGDGDGGLGELAATVTRPEHDERATLRAARDAAGLRVDAEGTLLGAPLDVRLRRDDGAWSGPLRIDALATPAGRVSATGTASGTGALPEARLQVRLDGPLPVTGTVTVESPPEATAEAAPARAVVALSADLPGGDRLAVRGEAWPSLDLTLSGSAPDAGDARLRAPSWQGSEPWRIEGLTRLELPGATVEASGAEDAGTPVLRVVPAGVRGGALRIALPPGAPAPALRAVASQGLSARGEGVLSGRAIWRPPFDGELVDLRWSAPFGELRLAGQVRDGEAELDGELVPAATPSDAGPQRALIGAVVGDAPLRIRLRGDPSAAHLAVDAAVAQADLTWRADAGELRLGLRAEGTDVALGLIRGAGLTGRVALDGVALPLPGGGVARLDGEVEADGGAVRGDAALRGPGRVTASGVADVRPYLPAAFRPPDAGAPPATEASLRLAELEVSSVPGLAQALPSLAGGVSAVVEVRGTRVLAQVTAPDLRTAGRAVPLRLDGAGDLGPGGRGVEFGGAWGGSPLQGTASLHGLELLWTLERFPVQAPLEARFGPLDVDAEATGALRLELPWRVPRDGAIRLATELVRLERAGVVTTGTFAVRADRHGVELDAAFEGEGSWRAEGRLAQDELDFVLQADDADATPMLGLVPALARLGAGARGDLTVTAAGDLRAPRIEAATDGLELALAGARYRLTDTRAVLEGTALRVDAALEGVEPVGGRLRVAGDARLRLDPWRLEDAGIALSGDLNVPLVGGVDAVEGTIAADPDGLPRLDLRARLGQPLTVEGTLWPLNVRARGDGLALRAPALLLDRSVSDVDLRLRYEERFHLSGRVQAREGRFALGIRPRADPDARADGPNPAPSRLAFQDVALVGRRLAFAESFGNAEFDADLRLGGTAAAPRLSGTATAQRGTFRFSGRDFDVRRGLARFEPSRGAFPTLVVEAVAAFDKRDVLASAAPGVTFEQPPGPRFEVRLSFEAEVLATPGEVRPFRLDLDPVLTSDALVSVPAGEGLSPGTRALTEPELLSLVTLGRLDLSGDLARGGVAGGVAASALDSAVDLLILAELQAALSEALGIDLVEIRTSTLSSVLAGDEDPFGVSLRLGGYVGEGLFASFEVGRFAGGDGDDALSNTLALTYQLGPVAFDLSTRLAFANSVDLTPTPALSAALRYQLTPFLAVETGASLSTPESQARFGVTLRW